MKNSDKPADASTRDYVEAEHDELNEIAIEHFLNILAEVALSAATRINQNGNRDER